MAKGDSAMSDFGAEWDLGEVLAERAQPTETVEVYLNEVASHAKVQLTKKSAKAAPEEVADLDAALAEVEAQLEKTKYTVHITAVPSRMREDITSKAMAKHPIRPNIMGQDDMENARVRRQLENDMIWHAQIVDVVNPAGQSRKSWTFEQIQEFSKALPTAAQNAIDSAIRKLTEDAEKFTTGSQSQDF